MIRGLTKVSVTRVATIGCALALGAGALSGCGVTGTDFHPGVAAQVGDESVSSDDVDVVVDGACEYLSDQPAQAGASLRSRSQLREQIAESLMEREAMSQLLDENGLEQPAEYRQTLGQLQGETADLPADQQDALSTANEAGVFVQTGQLVLGRSAVAADPAIDPADNNAALTAGAQALADWILSHDVEVNPIFGFTADEVTVEQTVVDQQTGQTIPVLRYPSVDDTSLPVSDLAALGVDPVVEAGAPQPTVSPAQQDYIDSLPSSQTCG